MGVPQKGLVWTVKYVSKIRKNRKVLYFVVNVKRLVIVWGVPRCFSVGNVKEPVIFRKGGKARIHVGLAGKLYRKICPILLVIIAASTTVSIARCLYIVAILNLNLN